MALDIRWTTGADIKLDQLIIYLESEWGESVVKAFMKKLYDNRSDPKRKIAL